MKYFQFFFVLLLSFQITLKAQNFSQEFSKISNDEIKLIHYDQDKSAEAVVLFDIGKSYFVRTENSFDVVFERTTRIKVFSDAGVKWAEVEIPFYQEGNIYEKIYDMEAYTYNFENGGLHKTMFDISNCHDEKVNEYWTVKKFALPDVKEGSIIEYKYKINSQYKFNLRDWEFQWKIPVVYSEYEVKMIPFYEYSWLLQGADKFDIHTSYQDKGMPRRIGPSGAYKDNTFYDMVYKFGMKDIPAFNDEEFISSINDYVIKIDFQLSKIRHLNGATFDVRTTWPDLIKDLLKHNDFGKYIKKSEKLITKLFNLDSLLNRPSNERFDMIINYVKGNFNWNKSNGKYASKSPNDFLKDKYGNCADINLFVVGLLNASGIEAYPVLISTRENGKIKYDYPYNHFFNYVLISANIDGNSILTDATEILSSNDRIPSRCINDKGLLINKEKVEWAGLQSLVSSELHTNLSIDVSNLDLNASVENLANEYYALNYRNIYGENAERIKEELNKNSYEVNDSSITVINQLDIKKPYILKYDIHTKTEIINEKIYVPPFLNEPVADNPLKQNTRTYPIDMTYPKKRIYSSSINIPDGYKVDFLPSDHRIKNELFELDYTVTSDDKKIQVSFTYYFKNSVYSANDYSKIKYYFNEIIKKGNEKVVLTKN